MMVALLGCFAHDRLNGRDATIDRLRTIALVGSPAGGRSAPPGAGRSLRATNPDSEEQGPVLVVDDDHEIRSAVRELLEGEGYRVFQAVDGRDALAVLAAIPFPRLIVLDLLMPIMNGWELLRALKRDPRLAAVPVVVLSAVTDFSPDEELTRFLRKPLDVDQLLALVHELTNR
jgi:CheY-like chemotaxis protein